MSSAKNKRASIPLINSKHFQTFIFGLFVTASLFFTGSPAIAVDNIKDIAIKFKDATSFYLLAQKYAIGGGTPSDYKEALKWYHEAAKLGHLKSEFQLGRFYYEGLGTDINYDEAARWLIEPANNGYNAAQYMIGNILLRGTDKLKKNEKKAFEWLQKAADDFNMEAALEVGKLYYYGIGVSKDIEQAKKYLKLAEEQNIEQAVELLAAIENDKNQNNSKDIANQARELVKTNEDRMIEKAETGDAEAQYKLASAYLNGEGLSKNVTRALTWMERAAKNGQKNAQYKLGSIYYDGKIVNRDLNKAKTWLNKAAKAGIKDAKFLANAIDAQLGTEEKRKVPENKSTGEIFLSAAQKGDKEAQFKVGLMYLYGDNGFAKNKEKALQWLLEAANQNHTNAQFQTGMMYYKPGADEDQRARFWLIKAAENGHVDAQYFLGTIYNQQKKYDLAAKWLDRAYEKKHKEALELLVEIYNGGHLDSADKSRIMIWLEDASTNGLRDAQFKLGEEYLHKTDLPNNEKIAFAWIEKSARKGYTPAKFKLATLYRKGTGVRKHYTKSARWFREAAEQGHTEAQFELAELYDQGLGLPRDKSKAKQWYQKAADQGHMKARIKLGSGSRY